MMGSVSRMKEVSESEKDMVHGFTICTAGEKVPANGRLPKTPFASPASWISMDESVVVLCFADMIAIWMGAMRARMVGGM